MTDTDWIGTKIDALLAELATLRAEQEATQQTIQGMEENYLLQSREFGRHMVEWNDMKAAKEAAEAQCEALRRALMKIIQGLADQQAMPDDWWKDALAAALAATPAGQQVQDV